MKNYTFKKVDEKPTLDSPVWNDVEKATLDNDNFCGENAEKITVTAQGVCTAPTVWTACPTVISASSWQAPFPSA